MYNFTDDEPPQPFIPFVGYWDDNNKVPWALPHVYDYMEGRDADSYSYQDVDSLVYWANEAAYRWKLRGMCMWSLGQEDLRLWEWLPKQV